MNQVFYSKAAWLLPRLEARRERWPWRVLQPVVKRFYQSSGQPIPVKLHGFDVRLNPGNTYPTIAHTTRFFNAPLVELTHQARIALKRPVVFVDIGASVGDSVLLLEQRCAGDVSKFICFEGDSEFADLLRHNVHQFSHVRAIQAMLARERLQVRSLVKEHLGSAASTGDESVEAKPLDDYLSELEPQVDILKIDVDGLDGEVLLGARGILNKFQPWVIFEWHPFLVKKAGQSIFESFEALAGCGYDRFVWYSNAGTFSHFTNAPNRHQIELIGKYLLAVNQRADEHFDVVALPPSAPDVEVALATLDYARSASRKFPILERRIL
jgi:FkbM family methyltransferase